MRVRLWRRRVRSIVVVLVGGLVEGADGGEQGQLDAGVALWRKGCESRGGRADREEVNGYYAKRRVCGFEDVALRCVFTL